MLRKYLIISISIIVFNFIIGGVFVYRIKDIQKNSFDLMERNYQQKAASITAMINLITSYYEIAGFDITSNMETRLEIVKANLGKDILNFSNVIITDIDGKAIFATHPCLNNNCSVKHRDYFLKSLKYPKEVHQGELVEGIISNTKAIPFSKALEYKDKVYGVIIIGLDIKEFNNSMIHHNYLNFKVSTTNNKNYWNNMIFQPLVKTLDNTIYELEVTPNHELLVEFIRFILPWNIIFLIVGYIGWQVQKGKHKIMLLYNHLFNNDSKVDYFRDKVLYDPYKITSIILTKVAELIKDYQFNISNIENTVAELIKEVRFNEIETAHLGEQLINLIRDTNVNLNEEYITTLKELHGNIADSIKVVGSLLNLLQQNLPNIKGGKESIKLNNIQLHLPLTLTFKNTASDCFIKVYIEPFYNLMDMVSLYFLLLCEEESCEVEVSILETSRLILTFFGSLKNMETKSIFLENNEALYYYKIKLLAQINSANLEITDKGNQFKLILEFPLERPANNILQSI